MRLDGTTIIAVKKDGKTVIAGDGQVTMGQSVVLKNNAVKVRRMYNDKVVVGFAGSVADAFTLSARFEEMLQKFSGNLLRSAVELAQSWRTDKFLRNLEAMMIAADHEKVLIISGDGNVIDPEEPDHKTAVCAIGSGGNYALAAAKALSAHTKMTAKEIAKEAMKIAGEICIFTNNSLTIEEI
ncbi:MAG: ATP-dependent protease subunit HslV [Christensenellaceae bacterium]|jgi:ATP-dependent HslUV protease subunit HslV|nr:ATP-dependent protease subunit HslV [Christensenellaceae bacterium]